MTPNVVGVILLLIALTLLPYLTRLMTGAGAAAPSGSAAKFALGIILVLLMATLAHRLNGFLKTISLLIGMLIGTVAFYVLELPEFKALLEASWLSIPQDIIPSAPTLALPAMVAFAVSYVAVVVNSIGSIQAIANVTSKDRLSEAIPRALLLNGASGVVCGIMGVVGLVSYSISPGVVLSNRVATRFATAFAGMVFVLAAFLPRLAALLTLIPPPVVGAALCVAMGVQIGAALSIIAGGDMERRDYYVVGLPVLLGTLLGFLPQGLVETVPQILRVFIGNGLTFGIVLVMLLEHVLMRRERAGGQIKD
jgi:uracil permease